MEYYNILNLQKEPFSNSPEPEFLFQSAQHTGCLQKLELAIRLRRGLNVVIGDIGTGKTTLCRKLIQKFSENQEDAMGIETHLLLDPAFDNPTEFLRVIGSLLGIPDLKNQESEWQLKEIIKNYLFDKGLKEGKIIVLIIDEGQKITESCLELLREFLNYETNDFKLLQIIVFAQKEFNSILKKYPNITDRINLTYYLQPLNFRQMYSMIQYRLNVAGNMENTPSFFTFGGIAAIYMATGGYPRKVVSLCHQVILKLIIQGKKKAGFFFVRSCINKMPLPLSQKIEWAGLGVLAIVLAGILINLSLFQGKSAIANKATGLASVSSVTDKSVANISNIIAEKQNKDESMPTNLGVLTLKEGRTIWWMLQNVYGDSSSQIISAVAKANPEIKNINRLNSGEVIRLPAIPANVNPIKNNDILVQLLADNDIEENYRFFREDPYKEKIPQTVFFIFWNKKEGIKANVVIDKCFKNMEEAQEAIVKLPSPISSRAKILSQWNEDTVFFNRQVLKR